MIAELAIIMKALEQLRSQRCKSRHANLLRNFTFLHAIFHLPHLDSVFLWATKENAPKKAHRLFNCLWNLNGEITQLLKFSLCAASFVFVLLFHPSTTPSLYFSLLCFFLQLVASSSNANSLMYSETKQAAASYQTVKEQWVRSLQEAGLGTWVRKPPEQEQFFLPAWDHAREVKTVRDWMGRQVGTRQLETLSCNPCNPVIIESW